MPAHHDAKCLHRAVVDAHCDWIRCHNLLHGGERGVQPDGHHTPVRVHVNQRMTRHKFGSVEVASVFGTQKQGVTSR